MSKCDCSWSISVLGDGCRYCQPQEYIDRLHGTLDDERKDETVLSHHAEELDKALDVLITEARAWDIKLHYELSCGEPYVEDQDVLNAIVALTNYREATK
jgi:hypothetical protein